MRNGSDTGFTLIEAIITLAIVSIMMGYAIPSASHIMKRAQATTAINWLVVSVNFTRHAAVTYRTTVTLCPSTTGRACGGPWHDGIIAFTDHNQDRQVNGRDTILRRFEFPLEDGTIRWRAFQNRQFLQMISSGYTNFQNGNFVYCPADGDLRYARQLVINVQGRPRTSKDRNDDGYVEDRSDNHLRC